MKEYRVVANDGVVMTVVVQNKRQALGLLRDCSHDTECHLQERTVSEWRTAP